MQLKLKTQRAQKSIFGTPHSEIKCGLSIKRNKFQWTKWVKIFTYAYGQGRGFVLRLPLYKTVEIYGMVISFNWVILDTLKLQANYCRTKKVQKSSLHNMTGATLTKKVARAAVNLSFAGCGFLGVYQGRHLSETREYWKSSIRWEWRRHSVSTPR